MDNQSNQLKEIEQKSFSPVSQCNVYYLCGTVNSIEVSNLKIL